MSEEKKFLGARLGELQLERALQFYREGRISIDKAAKIAGITINEMMQEAAAHGIRSEETIEEYKEGVKILIAK